MSNPLDDLRVIMLQSKLDGLQKRAEAIVGKGEGPGHPFRGNQYTSGSGDGSDDLWTPVQNKLGDALEREFNAQFAGPTGGGGDPEDALNYDIGSVQVKILPKGGWRVQSGARVTSGTASASLKETIRQYLDGNFPRRLR